jgi:hypothetical protein
MLASGPDCSVQEAKDLTMAPAMLLKFSSLLSVYIILSSSLVSFTQSFMFLIRVRSNVGTWKLQLDSDDSDDTRRNKGDLTVRDVLSDGIFEAWQLVQPLSLDPSGKEPLSKTKTLQQQGLKHGSMIYCRVEERDLLANDSDDNGNSLVSPTATTSQIKDQALHGKSVCSATTQPLEDGVAQRCILIDLIVCTGFQTKTGNRQ